MAALKNAIRVACSKRNNGIGLEATGQMRRLLAVGKSVVARGLVCNGPWGRRELVSRDGEPMFWAGRCGIERGKPTPPTRTSRACSACTAMAS